jgi:hypothetical protein
MPEIARVLAHGGSSPPDFTLHDAEHSFRVAEWMARLMPGGLLERLSEYEIALLLLSAYLHDIGMTPELDKVRRHRDFLLTGNTDLLTADEARDLQHWLDAAGYGAAGPCDRARPQDETVREADEIIAGYTRHRHNDWSEAWIRKRFEGEPLGTYEGWMADVIRLCRSHHEGYEALVGRQFDPRRVGSDARVVHLRYLAALLRVADVLDVDRERTPAGSFTTATSRPRAGPTGRKTRSSRSTWRTGTCPLPRARPGHTCTARWRKRSTASTASWRCAAAWPRSHGSKSR